MITKRALIDNALIKQIIAIRADSLWKMIGRHAKGCLPAKSEKGASGKFDNKGAIFIPGGFIFRHFAYQYAHQSRQAVAELCAAYCFTRSAP